MHGGFSTNLRPWIHSARSLLPSARQCGTLMVNRWQPGIPLQLFALIWSSPDVVGLFSINVVSFSRNVVLRGLLFSLNSVSKPRMLSVRTVYVFSSLHLTCFKFRFVSSP